ncbi:UDP-glucuronosyltransferase 2C1-like isoform X1 [Tachysurus ichikawai]
MSTCELAALRLLLLLSLIQTPPCTTAGKILVWPADFSHWFNINVIIEELLARGHNVIVVTHSATPSVKTEQSPGYDVEIIRVPYTKQDVFNTLDTMFKYWVNEVPNDDLIQSFLKIKDVLDQTTYKNQSTSGYFLCSSGQPELHGSDGFPTEDEKSGV